MYCFSSCKFENTNLVSQRAVGLDSQTEECADVFVMSILYVQKVNQSPGQPGSGTRFVILHSGNTSQVFVREAICEIFCKYMHTTNFENQYAGVMLAALGIEQVPMLSTVDNVNGL